MPLLFYVPLLSLLAAGVIHGLIAPEHFAHAPAHGLFFAAVGVFQMLWSGLRFWKRGSKNPLWTVTGLLLSGGVIVVWLLTHLIAAPFSPEAHAIDGAAIASKLLELIAFVALVIGGEAILPTRSASRRAVLPLTFSMASGAVIWLMGLIATPLLPGLAETAGHSHDHDHGSETASGLSTSAYFSIVNSGTAADTLVSVSSIDIPSVTLHQTNIDAQAVARMDGLDGVTLTPHVRVDFAPAGNHVMLEGLTRDLYEGDTISLILHFASGKSVPVVFEVVLLTPDARINFVRVDDFQISNAWARATATLDGSAVVSQGSYEWQLPPGFPMPRVPDNNPMTAEKVELGRFLFYDVRLSGNSRQSCSTCHVQAMAFTDGRALAVGSTGESHPRNSMSLTNAAYNATLTWANPTLTSLERQIPNPMFGEHPIELGITGNEEQVLSRFRDDPAYQQMFAAAFPGETDLFTFNNITLALASFTRTLISGSSPYDQYVQGDPSALSESAQRGMELFLSEGLECHHCHTGFNFTLSTVTANSTFEESPFFNTGLYNVGGTGAYPTGNTGVHEITNQASDMGRFRPPTLRNIALTAPYMHDGSIASLEEVIVFYMDGGRLITEGPLAGDGRANPFKSGLVPGFTLTAQEMADLLAFLDSLTDQAFITDPRFSDPFMTSAGS